MKKSLSNLNLLKGKLNGKQYQGFWDYLLHNRKIITIEIPYYEYLRGTIFIDDLRENYKDKVPYNFDVASLIYLLYDDFMKQVKRGASNKEIAQFLLRGKEEYFYTRKKEKRVMKAITERLLEFQSIEEEEIVQTNEKKAYIDLKMEEREILRGEVLLHDLEVYLNDVPIRIEDILAIRFLDFISDLKKEGNSLSVQKSIVSRFIS